MLNRIIAFSLRNRPTVCALFVLLLAWGCYVTWHIEVDVFPDLNAPTVVVMTESGDLAPEEVEQWVTFPVETAVNGATGVRRVRSSSTTGLSVVWVEFDWDTDVNRARQVIGERIAALGGQMPEGVGTPVMGPPSSILGEVMFVGLVSDTLDATALRTLADRQVRPRLLALPGVAQVSVLGGDVREYQILLHPDRMRQSGVGVSALLEAVENMNRNASGGVYYEYGNEYIIRGMIATTDIEAMRMAVVRAADGSCVPLGELAEVCVGVGLPRLGEASIDGHEAVLLTVTKQPHVGTLQLTAALDDALAGLSESLPAGVEVRTDLYRQQRFIDASIGNIRQSLVEGGLFVVLVLFIFLMNVRTTLISLVTIPLSLLVSVVVLRWMGLSVNTMSIGGMAIAIGSLVDDAIVDVENVYRHLRRNRALPPDRRRPLRDVVYEASREVRLPILNSTLIIVVSFVPLFCLSGMEGRMLAPLGVAFIVSLFASTGVALTLTPVLCSYLLGQGSGKHSAVGGHDPWVTRHLRRLYASALGWTVGHRPVVLVCTGALFVLAVVGFTRLGRSFLPPFNEGSLTVNISALPGISLEESGRLGRQAELVLLDVPEIRAVARKTGRAELDEHALGVNTSEIEAPFELSDRSKEAFMADVRARLRTLPGVNVEIGQPISHRIDAMLSGTQANIAIKLFGDDLNRLFALGNQVRAAIADVPGVEDLTVEQQVERPQLQIRPRRELLAAYGITTAELAEAIDVLAGGRVVSQVYEGGLPVDLVVRVDAGARASAEGLASLPVQAADGTLISLGEVADVVSASGPNTINRENVVRKIVVSANVAGRDMRSTVDDIRRQIDAQVLLPAGYRIEYGGQFESESAASRTLLAASVFSILVILMLLYRQFRRMSQAVVVLLNLPLALIGGVLAVWSTSGILSIPGIIGFISLFGIATRNGMLLIDRYNELRRTGLPVIECVRRGSMDRLNPIVMTALTSALALIPLALGGDLPGNEIQSPMAQVMLGGLVSSTLLNAFVIPVVYLLMEQDAPSPVASSDGPLSVMSNQKELEL